MQSYRQRTKMRRRRHAQACPWRLRPVICSACLACSTNCGVADERATSHTPHCRRHLAEGAASLASNRETPCSGCKCGDQPTEVCPPRDCRRSRLSRGQAAMASTHGPGLPMCGPAGARRATESLRSKWIQARPQPDASWRWECDGTQLPKPARRVCIIHLQRSDDRAAVVSLAMQALDSVRWTC